MDTVHASQTLGPGLIPNTTGSILRARFGPKANCGLNSIP